MIPDVIVSSVQNGWIVECERKKTVVPDYGIAEKYDYHCINELIEAVLGELGILGEDTPYEKVIEEAAKQKREEL